MSVFEAVVGRSIRQRLDEVEQLNKVAGMPAKDFAVRDAQRRILRKAPRVGAHRDLPDG